MAVRELLTLEATYTDGSTTEHGFVVPEGAKLKKFAVECAALLEKSLEDKTGKVVTLEEVEVKDGEIKSADVDAELAKQP